MDSNWKLICPPCMPEKSSTERNGALSWIGSRIIWPCQNRAQEQFCCRCVGCLQLRAGGKSKKLQNLIGVTSNLDSFPFCFSTVNDNLLTWNKKWKNVKYDWQISPRLKFLKKKATKSFQHFCPRGIKWDKSKKTHSPSLL